MRRHTKNEDKGRDSWKMRTEMDEGKGGDGQKTKKKMETNGK